MKQEVKIVFEYNPKESNYEELQDNRKILVVHGSGYDWNEGDIPNEEDFPNEFDGYNIDNPIADKFVRDNYKMQRVTYFKEIELAEEFNLEEDFLDKLFDASKGQWINYSDLSGTVFFKILEER